MMTTIRKQAFLFSILGCVFIQFFCCSSRNPIDTTESSYPDISLVDPCAGDHKNRMNQMKLVIRYNTKKVSAPVSREFSSDSGKTWTYFTKSEPIDGYSDTRTENPFRYDVIVWDVLAENFTPGTTLWIRVGSYASPTIFSITPHITID